ncbi:hypothetical protein BGX26_001044 [Mortierella sp. AD094]|nr:hypothetical protein BGX26_001044 [Mortierella sp. AD094]
MPVLFECLSSPEFTIRGTELAQIDQVEVEDAKGGRTTESIALGKDWSLHLHTKFSTCYLDMGQDDSVGATRFGRQQMLEQEHTPRQLSQLKRLEKLVIICFGEEPHRGLDLILESHGGGLDKTRILNQEEML